MESPSLAWLLHPPTHPPTLQIVDYSWQPMSLSVDVRSGVGKRLLAAAAVLEHEFGEAQVGVVGVCNGGRGGCVCMR